MSPFNRFLELEGDGEPEPHLDQVKRGEDSPASADATPRNKRFGNGRRQNSINGMQRRRNKRANW